jgi:hypothetical protein
MFNFYARRYSDKYTDFDQQHNNLFFLTLRGYIAFVNDMDIPVDKARVIEVFKKSCKN